jgi:VanZ family protein
MIICTFYGFSDEFHQYFVPNRDANFYDWIADVVGVVLTLVIIKFILAKRYSLFRKQHQEKFLKN